MFLQQLWGLRANVSYDERTPFEKHYGQKAKKFSKMHCGSFRKKYMKKIRFRIYGDESGGFSSKQEQCDLNERHAEWKLALSLRNEKMLFIKV